MLKDITELDELLKVEVENAAAIPIRRIQKEAFLASQSQGPKYD